MKCIDLYRVFEEKLRSTSPVELYIDGLHPKKLGHEIIADVIANSFGVFK